MHKTTSYDYGYIQSGPSYHVGLPVPFRGTYFCTQLLNIQSELGGYEIPTLQDFCFNIIKRWKFKSSIKVVKWFFSGQLKSYVPIRYHVYKILSFLALFIVIIRRYHAWQADWWSPYWCWILSCCPSLSDFTTSTGLLRYGTLKSVRLSLKKPVLEKQEPTFCFYSAYYKRLHIF